MAKSKLKENPIEHLLRLKQEQLESIWNAKDRVFCRYKMEKKFLGDPWYTFYIKVLDNDGKETATYVNTTLPKKDKSILLVDLLGTLQKNLEKRFIYLFFNNESKKS